jgi:hypothetical protein
MDRLIQREMGDELEINRSRQIWISFEPSQRKGGLAVGKKRDSFKSQPTKIK